MSVKMPLIGSVVGYVDVKDPSGGPINSVALSGDGYLELLPATIESGFINRDYIIVTALELDYETLTGTPIHNHSTRGRTNCFRTRCGSSN